MRCFLIVLLFVFVATGEQYEGEVCEINGRLGECTKLDNCPQAIIDIGNRIRPKTCSFQHSQPIVCCAKDFTGSNSPVATTSSPRQRTPSTTEYIPPVYEYEDLTDRSGGCEPIPKSLTSAKTGQKAWDKCIEYQEKLVFPCERSAALSGDLGRSNNCKHNADELIIGGTNAAANEFPHMVSLGFENDDKSINWECGGSLISERYVLTAAHCLANRVGNVTHAIVGSLRRTDDNDGKNLYRIKTRIPHPGYALPNKYNDIMLLELDREVALDQFKVPACVHTGSQVDDSMASTTGWGVTVNRGTEHADIMQKVILKKFTVEECKLKYRPFRNLKAGVETSTQFCYGDKTMSKDTCQGDSGGPLQIKSKDVYCMYTLVGITSFGKACGFEGVPGIYTRVSAYVGWIESIVWP